MPQSPDSTNYGQRRDQGIPTEIEYLMDPMAEWRRRIEEIMCSVGQPSSPAYPIPPVRDFNDRTFLGATRERTQVLRQQLKNGVTPHWGNGSIIPYTYGFVSDARRQNKSIAQVAEGYRGSMAWGVDVGKGPMHLRNVSVTRGQGRPHLFLPKSDKCNEFVADVLIEAGCPSPTPAGTNRPASAQEYALARISIVGLSMPMPLSMAQRGDIIAQDHGDKFGHVGIVIQKGLTASASELESGRIVINDWGFREAPKNGESIGGPPPVVRRVQWRAAYHQP